MAVLEELEELEERCYGSSSNPQLFIVAAFGRRRGISSEGLGGRDSMYMCGIRTAGYAVIRSDSKVPGIPRRHQSSERMLINEWAALLSLSGLIPFVISSNTSDIFLVLALQRTLTPALPFTRCQPSNHSR